MQEALTTQIEDDDDSVSSSTQSSWRSRVSTLRTDRREREKPLTLREGVDLKDFQAISIDYEDCFKTFSYIYWHYFNKKSKPNITVWGESSPTLLEPIPKRRWPKEYSGKRNPEWTRLAIPSQQIEVLMKGTHWGVYLSKHLTKQSKISNKKSFNWCKKLSKKIKNFLKGKGHPSWKNLSTYYSDPERNRRGPRASRFIELLKTAAGAWFQQFLAEPNAQWSWEKYDVFILNQINELITDEFFDGTLTPYAMRYKTVYKKRKDIRNLIKDSYYKGKPCVGKHSLIGLYNRLAEMGEGNGIDPFISLLIQNRGVGTPPPLVKLRSKIKFLETVSETPVPLKPFSKKLVHSAIALFDKTIPGYIFTGLNKQARVRLPYTSCIEANRSRYGKVGAMKDLLGPRTEYAPYQTYDLVTGEPGKVLPGSSLTTGEKIFWRSLQVVVGLEPEILGEVFLTIVNDNGKARSITKARLALTVILDCVSSICSKPLGKIESSKSGMKMSSHPWNVFNEMFEGSFRDMLFEKEDVRKTPFVNSEIHEEYYRQIWAGALDEKTATDWFHPWVAGTIGSYWMRRCGIAPMLRGIVTRFSFMPRKVYFRGTGPLELYGQPTDIPGLRYIMKERGILMGDPLTKCILHLHHILSERILQLLKDPQKLGVKVLKKDLVHEVLRPGV